VGRGVAIALGQAGWAVYLTARSSRARRTGHLPGTVDDTAAAIEADGGSGFAVVCDHRDDAAVMAVAERIGREQGRLDLLVNNAWGGYERLNAGGWPEWIAPFWEQPAEHFDAMFAGGVRMHYMTARASAPLLLKTPGSVMVTLSVTMPPGDRPGGVAYAMAKAADDMLAAGAARDLGPSGVTSVALHPGWVRTEGVMQFADQLDLTASQSPEGVGRVIAALAADPARSGLNGQICTVTGLADRYGTDVAS
jgi:NAD(P)-dependent dehydrogenase (short-subunit alcohol dehydrogenase family)